MVHDGTISRQPKGFELKTLVHEYVAFCKQERKDGTKAAVTNRAQLARAAEIEARMARESRAVIEIEEAAAAMDDVCGEFIQTLGSMPARITRDPRERQRLEVLFDTERLRLADHFSQATSSLRAGDSVVETEAEADA